MLIVGSSIELAFDACEWRGGGLCFVGVNVAQPVVQSTTAIQLATIVCMNLNELLLPTYRELPYGKVPYGDGAN